MNFLISLATICLMYAFVFWAEAKKQRELKKARENRWPRAYRPKSFMIIVLITAASCTTTRFEPLAQQQVRLVAVKRMPHSTADLTLITRTGDTLHMLERNPYMTTKKYYLNEWYTIRYDSTKKSMIDGRCYYMAILKHNL